MTSILTMKETFDEVETRIRICREKRSRVLDLSDAGLSEVPEKLQELKYLEVLKLSENSISELPDFLGSLEKLEFLDLSYNKLSVLPQSIGNLAFLNSLNVRCNELTEIPESLGKLVSLSSLDISYNRLSQLPETMNALSCLEHCNAKGNNLQTLPEKIALLNTPKNMTLLGHIERIIDLTGINGLSDSLFFAAETHIKYIIQKLRITPAQAVLFSHIVSEYQDYPIGFDAIAHSVNCGKIKLMQYINDFEELVRKKLIRSSRKTHNGGTGYSIPKEVLLSLMRDREYQPVNQSNLSVVELFIRMESLFEQCVGDQEISYDELLAAITELLGDNAQLPFVKKVCGYELSKDELLLLIRFCHLYINRDKDELSFGEISAMYDHHSQFSPYRRQLKAGEHILMRRGLVEFANSESFGNREIFKLSDMAIDKLLAELKIKSPLNCKDIIRAAVIQDKKLFYNKKENEQVQRLTSLLDENAFEKIKSRLSDAGMRTGFACIFSGPPGTGKSETAYQMARLTGRDIMNVDISQTKSMWFGESEKKIKAIFTRYRDYVKEFEVTPILLFNEADAVFGKRKDVSSSAVAQTENSIQNIILQEMENLKGILIATTNLAENLDAAFERRFLYKIEFGKPDLAAKQSIWQSLIPALSAEAAGELARRFDFSGGQIENISRKRAVEFVMTGNEPDLDRLIMFCEEELLNKEPVKRIGFTV